MVNVFIVEDNHDHLLSLTKKSENLGYKVIGNSNRAMGALEKIEQLQPAIVLIDIHLNGDDDGIQLARQIRKTTQSIIVFITAMTSNEVMQKAFVTNPDSYLVKPIVETDLKAAVELALFKKTNSKLPQALKTSDLPEYLTVRTGFKLRNIKFDDIQLLQTDQKNYLTLHTTDQKKYSIRKSIKSLIGEMLPPAFIQVHRHYVVNIRFVRFISEREQMIEMKNNQSIPIGRTYKKALYDRLNLV